MNRYELRYTPSGHALIFPGDRADVVVDALMETGYVDEFCLSPSFDAAFVASLMSAGFLVMSLRAPEITGTGGAILLPKLHLHRAVLALDELRETRSAVRLLKRYELRVDVYFEAVLDRCAAVHGDDWLTDELRAAFLGIRKLARTAEAAPARLVSFALFREDRLVAGEFGVVVGGVYTSYSGYRDEPSAGTVQMILTGRHLRDSGFAFWDLGMPMEYKTALGARAIVRKEFVSRFRAARELSAQSMPSRTVRA